MKKWILIGLVGLCGASAWAEILVTNLVVTQGAGTKTVQISYDAAVSYRGWVYWSVSNGTDFVNVPNMTGLGWDAHICTDGENFLWWDMWQDWNENVSSNMSLRLSFWETQPVPDWMVMIPEGTNSGTDPDFGDYSLTVNSFGMDKTEVTNGDMIWVMQWAYEHGLIQVGSGYVYAEDGFGVKVFLDMASPNSQIRWDGSTFGLKNAKFEDYPCMRVSWFGAMAYCNYRSHMEGKDHCYHPENNWSVDFTANGYRLPTREEWEYAARGGLSGKRFPWGDTITHDQANYDSSSEYSYDISSTREYHPLHETWGDPENPDDNPYTSPVGSFPANEYGLYDMSGNVRELCHDKTWDHEVWLRGGSWGGGGWANANNARCGSEIQSSEYFWDNETYDIGFRTVLYLTPDIVEDTSLFLEFISLDSRTYTLSISSDHGSPNPASGTNDYAWHSAVSCSVDASVTSGLTNWVSAGWTGTGSAPLSGDTNQIESFILTNLVSSVEWMWDTQYWLDMTTVGTGSVSPSNGWYAADSDVSLQATPSADWLFMGWSGDASGDYTQENILIPMVKPIVMTASFSDDADQDGLSNVEEVGLGTDPRKKDTDGDKMDDSAELVAGTSPTKSESVLTVDLTQSGTVNEISWFGVSGRFYLLEYTDDLDVGWLPMETISSGADTVIQEFDFEAAPKRFYRVRVSESQMEFAPEGMVAIPGGTNNGTDPDYGAYSLTADEFWMGKTEVTNDEMIRVMQWAYDNGKLTVSSIAVTNALGKPRELLNLGDSDCRIIWDGSTFGLKSTKGAGYPCVMVTWYGSVAYCNYRSEMEDRELCYNLSDWSFDLTAKGYCLPTGEEWEYAARGGLTGKRFPWGDTINHDHANYKANGSSYSYDTSPYKSNTYHPSYDDDGEPYTSPCGAFAANGYGLYDMAGNVWEWSNDGDGSGRVIRGGGWHYSAYYARCGYVYSADPNGSYSYRGFRAACH